MNISNTITINKADLFFNSKQTPQSPTQQPAALTDAKQNVEVKVEAPKTPTVEESKPPMTSSSSLLGDTATKDTEKAWTEKVGERSKACRDEKL